MATCDKGMSTESQSRPEATPKADPPHNRDQSQQSIPLRVLLRPLAEPTRKHWRLLLITIISGWGKFLLPAALPWLTAVIVDRLLTPAANGTRPVGEMLEELMYYSGGAVVVVALVGIATYYRHALAQRFAARLQHHLRKQLFRHIQHLSMSFLPATMLGRLGRGSHQTSTTLALWSRKA